MAAGPPTAENDYFVLHVIIPALRDFTGTILAQEYDRRPQTLSVRWRHRGEGWSRTSASTPLPAAVCPPFSGESQAAALVAAALALLARHVAEPFVLTLLNMGEATTTVTLAMLHAG